MQCPSVAIYHFDGAFLMSEVTRILNAIEQGEPQAAEDLLPLVYEELRRLAGRQMANEKPGQTLDGTGLVHEAYLRLVGVNRDRKWEGRRHFFATAAEAMRRILIENARRKRRLKRGGELRRVTLDDRHLVLSTDPDEVLAVDEAIVALAQVDHQAAELVKMHYFTGFTIEEAAKALDIPVRSAYRDWAYARAWLYRFLSIDDAR